MCGPGTRNEASTEVEQLICTACPKGIKKWSAGSPVCLLFHTNICGLRTIDPSLGFSDCACLTGRNAVFPFTIHIQTKDCNYSDTFQTSTAWHPPATPTFPSPWIPPRSKTTQKMKHLLINQDWNTLILPVLASCCSGFSICLQKQTGGRGW